MRRPLIILLIGSVCFASGAGLCRSDHNPTDAWSHDVRAAHKQSVRENRPMLLVFGAEWCTYCKKLEKTTLADSRVSKMIKDDFIPVHLDADEEKELMKILKIKSLPSTVIVSPDVQILGHTEGYKSTAEFTKYLADNRGRNSQSPRGTMAGTR